MAGDRRNAAAEVVDNSETVLVYLGFGSSFDPFGDASVAGVGDAFCQHYQPHQLYSAVDDAQANYQR